VSNLYDDLGIEPDASQDEIKAAHRKAARQHHPDAGGDPEHFHKAQNAYLVLRDPDRRAQYDRDGTADQPQDDRLQGAMALIQQCFDAMMSQGNPEHQDIIDLTRAALTESRDVRRAEQVKAKAQVAKARKRRKRLTYRGTRGDLIGKMLDDRIAEIEAQVRGLSKAIEAHGIALEILDDYEWEFDEPPSMPMRGFTSTSTGSGWP